MQTDQVPIINQRSPISVIIAARDNARYLAEAIESAINQSHKPLEIIYSDDGSSDYNLQVAEKYRVGILTQHRSGVCAARNRACAIARGEFLLHLDGDDVLPSNFLQLRLKAARSSGSSLVYGAAQAFGMPGWNQYWEAPEWDRDRLWHGNFVNTTSLLRKDHFLEVGGWHESIGTAWDWSLATRIGRRFPVSLDRSSYLLYRQHNGSVSFQSEIKRDLGVTRMQYLFRATHCRLNICGIISSRVPWLFKRWIERIVENIDEYRLILSSEQPYNNYGTIVFNSPKLILQYTGTDPKTLLNILSQYHDKFSSIEIQHNPWANIYNTEQERRDNVSRFLASGYNRLLDIDGEICWLIEDDILPPKHALSIMTYALLSGPPKYAVSGLYRSRHDPHHFVAHGWQGGKVIELSNPEWADLVGTGCLMIFKPMAKHRFESHLNGIAAHDWAWCRHIKNYSEDWHTAKRQVLVLPDVRCDHFIDETTSV